MKIYLFYHSIVSDWNNGNAHFLRGMVSSLITAGHQVIVYEPLNGWSFNNLLCEAGIRPVCEYYDRFPDHKVRFYDEANFSPACLYDADLVIVHEWNKPEIIKAIGNHKKKFDKYALLFHDTHHRAISDPSSMEQNDLSGYDGVLAFGKVIKNIYIDKNWAPKAWVWHEAADTNIFKPLPQPYKYDGDLVWVGNWGDNERTREIIEYIIEPIKELGLKARFYGVRYPLHALSVLKEANIEYGGWLPNYKVPEVFSKFKMTVHVPRQPYVVNLPGIPTIRPFEAMACGIPLISSPWNDAEGLFRVNTDFLMVNNGAEMKKAMKEVLSDHRLSTSLVKNGLETIGKKHTCEHRKNELLEIINEILMFRKVPPKLQPV